MGGAQSGTDGAQSDPGGAEPHPDAAEATRSPHRTTARTKARRRAMDVVFELDQKGHYGPGALRSLLRERLAVSTAQTALPQYSADIVEGLAEHAHGIDQVLSTYLQGWTLPRLPAVDRAILRIATWELLYGGDVDAPVVITEAVNLAEDLSTDDSPAFVNAVLDRLRMLAPVLVAEIAAEEEAADARARAAEARRAEEE
ncbi:MAG TPA: transcription antitermination factor NusB, partial [Actinomycetales bacterium]|nr:transcription antitermination factor NusB [Actinomycetales bacterium]